MVTDVAAPLFVNVAVPSGTLGVELQFVPWVHSFGFGGRAVQVPSSACAVLGVNMASAPSQTLPSSAARLRTAGTDVAATRIALSRSRRAVPRRRLPADATRMNAYPNPCGRLPPRFPIIARAVPPERTIAPRPTLRVEPVTINS